MYMFPKDVRYSAYSCLIAKLGSEQANTTPMPSNYFLKRTNGGKPVSWQAKVFRTTAVAAAECRTGKPENWLIFKVKHQETAEWAEEYPLKYPRLAKKVFSRIPDPLRSSKFQLAVEIMREKGRETSMSIIPSTVTLLIAPISAAARRKRKRIVAFVFKHDSR